MAKHIYNLSFDSPEKIKGTNNDNSFKRKELVKFLIRHNVIDYDNTFTIYHQGKEYKKVNIAYFVKTTLIFCSSMDVDKVATLLNQHKNELYYVLTEVVVKANEPYFAYNLEDEDLQEGFENEVEEIKKEIKAEILDIKGIWQTK